MKPGAVERTERVGQRRHRAPTAVTSTVAFLGIAWATTTALATNNTPEWIRTFLIGVLVCWSISLAGYGRRSEYLPAVAREKSARSSDVAAATPGVFAGETLDPREARIVTSPGGTMPTFNYTVDDEAQSTTSHDLTADEILKNAGFDTARYYLVQVVGHDQVSYKDKGSEPIHMHEHMKFITVQLGPTPLSRWR